MILLCKPGGVTLGVINGIEEDSATLHMSVSETWELRFDVQRFIDIDGVLAETNYYKSISEMMELYLECQFGKIRFQIDKEPITTNDGVEEKKSVTAHSIEVELQTKFLHQFKVNCGTSDSQEYLVGYYDENGEFINVNLNPYTNLPIDYIVIYNDYTERLAEVKENLINLGIENAVSTVDGQITKTDELYDYLYKIYYEYPRLSGDPISEEDFRVYLTLSNDTFYVGHDENQFDAAFLLDGIDRLISFYQQYGNQLSLISLAFENATVSGWSIGNIPENIRHKKYNFSIDSRDILSFLKEELSQKIKVIVDFDRMNRKVDMIDVVDHDEEFDTGVFFTYRNLLNSVDIQSSSDDGIRTKFIPTGANNLGITYVNFGENAIYDLDWLMDKIDEYDDNQYVSTDLHDKYHAWKEFRNSTPVTYSLNDEVVEYDNRRIAYSDLTKRYNQYMIDIDAIKNKLPNDGCSVDYTTFPFKDLNIAYRAYMNALETLEQLYMSDVGAVSFDRATTIALDSDGNIKKNIKDTFYWNDFICYRDTIIPNVMNALKMYVLTDSDGNLDPTDPTQRDQETGDWIEYEGGNPWYNGDSKRVTENMFDAYIYDMSLYGTVELAAKQKAWRECAATLFKPGYILDLDGHVLDIVPTNDQYVINTPDDAGWAKLDDEHKQGFTGQVAFEKGLTEYLDYMSKEVRDNALTKMQSKGVVWMCQDAIDALQPSIDAKIEEQQKVQDLRKDIAAEVTFEAWDFTDRELEILHTLVREANYNNSNILITNLDDIVSTVDAEEELYQDALIALSEKSRPQLAFRIESDNLFALDEFKDYQEQVRLLNFVRVSIGLYEDEFVKLRIISIECNPLIPDDNLSLEFSNMTYSLQGASDFAYLFENLNGGTTSSGNSSSGGSSGGSYGDNDADITLANNMLNALLKSRNYTQSLGQTIVGDIVNNQEIRNLLAQSGAFEKLSSGEIRISGECLVDIIKSFNYNGTELNPLGNTAGSYQNLTNGTFNLGGGGIIWDGHDLVIKADTVMIGNQNLANQITAIENQVNDVQDIAEETASYLQWSDSDGLIIGNPNATYGTSYKYPRLQLNRGTINLLVDTDNDGTSATLLKLNDEGLEFYDDNGNSDAVFGSDNTRVGYSNQYHISIANDSITIANGGTEILQLDKDSISYNGNDLLKNSDFISSLTNNIKTSSASTTMFLSGNGQGTATVDISESGYTPIGIIGYNSNNGDVVISAVSLNGSTQAQINARNLSSSSITTNITINVLKIKNTARLIG